MTPQAFIAKWSAGAAADGLSERAGAQAHFIDLCRLLDVPEPADPEAYCFELGSRKTGGSSGWADYSPAMPDEEILARLLALNRARAAGLAG